MTMTLRIFVSVVFTRLSLLLILSICLLSEECPHCPLTGWVSKHSQRVTSSGWLELRTSSSRPTLTHPSRVMQHHTTHPHLWMSLRSGKLTVDRVPFLGHSSVEVSSVCFLWHFVTVPTNTHLPWRLSRRRCLVGVNKSTSSSQVSWLVILDTLVKILDYLD